MKKNVLLMCFITLAFTFGVVMAAEGEPGEGEACGTASSACAVTNPQCEDNWHARLGSDGETWYCCGQKSYTGRQCKPAPDPV